MFALRRQVLLTVYAAAAACLAAFYFIHYPIPGFFLRLREIVTASVFLVLAAATGQRLGRLLRLPPTVAEDEAGPAPSATDNVLWGVGLGVPAIALCLLFLGLAGAFRPAGFALLTVGLAAFSWKEILRLLSALRPLRVVSAETSGFHLFLSVLGAAVLATALLCAFAPPTYYDSLVYHLALPAKYLQEGRIGFVPYNHYSHFPQGMEMVYAWFLALGDDVSAQVFNVFIALLLAAAVWRLGKTRLSIDRPRWDIVLFLTAPCVTLLASETYVELPLAFWTLLCLWAAANGLERNDRRSFVLAGLMAGFATGLKYTGILTPAVLFALILFWPRPRTARERAGDALALFLPAFLVFLPWLVKNFLFTGGNPVFPFLPQWFPADNVYMHRDAAGAYFRVLDEYRGTSPLLMELFGLPLRLVTNVVSFGGGYDVTGDLGWALPLILLPLAFLALPGHRVRGFFLVYLLAHALLWASLRPVLRFLFPVFPILCLLSGLGLVHLFSQIPVWAGRALTAVLLLFFLSNGVLFYLVERVRDPFPAALGLMDREDYLRRKLDAYPAWEFINKTLPADSRVLFVGDQRGYYCRRPYLAPMALLPQPLREWADTAETGEQLRSNLLKLGFTHVFFNRKEADRLKGYRVLDLTEHGRTTWSDMRNRLSKDYDTPDATIYSLNAGARND